MGLNSASSGLRSAPPRVRAPHPDADSHDKAPTTEHTPQPSPEEVRS